MTGQTGRITILALLVVVAFTAGGAVGTVAADDGNDADDESEITFHVGVTSSEASGQTTWDCSGTVEDNGCDEKNGSLDAGPVAVDYVGDNYFRIPAQEGGGGDHFDVTVGDQSGGVGFDCDFSPSNQDPCEPESSGP